MKKRLLITSIVMMLVVAVALSTATYAWFTSNASVTASSISLEAATSTSDAIGIGWTAATVGTSITPNDFSREGGLKPAVPSSVTANTADSAITFKGGTLKNENGADVYNDDVAVVEPYVWNGDISSQNYTSFFIKNLSTARTLDDLYMSALIDGEGAELVRIAVFAKDSGTFKLVNVLGYTYTYTAVGDAAYAAGTNYYKKGAGWKAEDAAARGYVKATEVTDASTYATNKANLYTRTAAATVVFYGNPGNGGARVSTSTATVTSINLLNGDASLAAGSSIELKVVVWFDGDKLDDQTQGRVAGIKLNFASNAAPGIN